VYSQLAPSLLLLLCTLNGNDDDDVAAGLFFLWVGSASNDIKLSGQVVVVHGSDEL
jgi:hypothetical protein